jgi:two-component system response regulator FixJ
MAGERTVYVVDDDAAVRRSLERLLHSAGFVAVTYATPSAFLDTVPQLASGCLVLDVRMPGMDGLELQERLDKLRISMPVIVVTAQGDVPTAVRAMKAGAADFIEKPFTGEALLAAVEAALNKPDRAESRETADAARRVARLSRREREVLDALVAGRPNKLIAYDLGISVRTVEVHRARMMERLGVRQLAEAIRIGLMANLATGNVPRTTDDT